MKKLVLTTCLLASQFIFSQQNDRPEREAFELQLKVDEEQYYGINIEKTPFFVEPNVLQIYPSEKLIIEVELKDNKIISMKVVKENLHPEKTIVLEFKQTTEGNTHDDMILSVTNPFEKSLNYDAAMYIVGHDKWLKTSIMPIYPKIAGYEMWNDIIITLILENWRLED